jgi:hypothetical protein
LQGRCGGLSVFFHTGLLIDICLNTFIKLDFNILLTRQHEV